MGKRMAKVWMPWEGLIQSPWPREKRDEFGGHEAAKSATSGCARR